MVLLILPSVTGAEEEQIRQCQIIIIPAVLEQSAQPVFLRELLLDQPEWIFDLGGMWGQVTNLLARSCFQGRKGWPFPDVMR